MSESPNNIDPKEATEAKLCAYLEGELSPPERAEIEKYLDNNPQHRQLLIELSKTRDMVRSLPRESAPVEIGEMFQERLERSLLLDGGDSDSSAPIGRINRWPQVMLIAAMVLLAAGLGVVIFFALPGRGPGPTQYSVATPPTTTPLAPMATSSAQPTVTVAPAASVATDLAKSVADAKPLADAPAAGAPADQSKIAPLVATTPTPTAVATAAPTEAEQPRRYDRAGTPTEAGRARMEKGATGEFNIASKNGGGFGGGGGGGAGNASFGVATPPIAIANNSVTPAFDAKALNDRLARSNESLRKIGASSNNVMCVVVSADDTSAAANQVRDYFVTNRIAYQPLPPDDVLTANAGGLALNNDGDAAQSNLRRMKASDAGFEAKKEQAGDAGAAAKASEAPKDAVAVNNGQRSYNDYAQKIQPRNGTAKEVQEAEANGWAQSQTQAPPAGQASNYNKSNGGYGNNANNAVNYKDSAGNMNGGNLGTAANTQQQGQQPQQQRELTQQAAQQPVPQADSFANANAPQQINLGTPAVAPAENNDAFVVTGLTRREAEQLSATLSTQRLGQTAAIVAPEESFNRGAGAAQFDFAGSASGSTTMPAQRQTLLFQAKTPTSGPSTAPSFVESDKADAIHTDEHLSITVAQLVGPGVDKTNTVKVAGDGKISLPMIEPVPAAGQTPVELEKQIATKYRDANLIAQPTVTVTRVAVSPTTSQTLADEMATNATTRPATGERFAGEPFSLAAATQPAAAAEKVDLIVLVQRNPVISNTIEPNAASAQQPTTQPSAPVQAK